MGNGDFMFDGKDCLLVKKENDYAYLHNKGSFLLLNRMKRER